MTVMTAASADERIACYAAGEIADGEVCFVGIGIPSHAAVLAKRTHAPGCTLVYESGVMGALPDEPPLSTGGPSVARGAAMIGDCLTVFGELQSGRIHVGVLSGAQVDVWGNINSTVIGPYDHPKLRLVGSGGAHDIAALAGRVVIVMPHHPRRLVARVDFVTSPGHAVGGRHDRGGGPSRLITSEATFSFPEGRLTLDGVRTGLDPERVLSELGISVELSSTLAVLPDPDVRLLAILRQQVLRKAG